MTDLVAASAVSAAERLANIMARRQLRHDEAAAAAAAAAPIPDGSSWVSGTRVDVPADMAGLLAGTGDEVDDKDTNSTVKA